MSAADPSNRHGEQPDQQTNTLLKHLPTPLIPYAELMRIHKPVGVFNIFFPYLFGALFRACIQKKPISHWPLLQKLCSIFIFAFLLRSAGCTWNDIADRDLDRLVQRTRSRPMARNAISVQAAYIFMAGQGGLCLALLSQLIPDLWISYGLPLSFLVWLYPFAKRITDYAQVVLGLTLGWGVLIGGATMGLDTLKLGMKDVQVQGLMSLYVLYGNWTVIHDIVYAHQDIKDDLKAGIGSMAVRWQQWTKTLLWILSLVQVVLLLNVGNRVNAGMVYYCVAAGGNILTLISMIIRLDLRDPQSCLWWFQWGSLAIGFSMTVGLWGEYLLRSQA